MTGGDDYFHGGPVQQDFRKALSLFLDEQRKDDDPYNSLDRIIGICYIKIHDYDKALFRFNEYLRKHTDETDLLVADALAKVAFCYERLDDRVNMKKYYSDAINLYSEKLLNFEQNTRAYGRLVTGKILLVIGFLSEKIGELGNAQKMLHKSLPIITNIVTLTQQIEYWNTQEFIEGAKVDELESIAFNKALIHRAVSKMKIEKKSYTEAKFDLLQSIRLLKDLENIMKTQTPCPFPDQYWHGCRHSGLFQDFGEIYNWELSGTTLLYQQVTEMESARGDYEQGYSLRVNSWSSENLTIPDTIEQQQERQPVFEDIISLKNSYKKWDLFICHASEDKDAIVRPLVAALKREGFKVWYDEFTLTIGDDLHRSIDKGLANSNYGIVILSRHFFDKEWPQKELDGLAARETKGKKVILPIWHNVDSEYIRKFSPTLAGKLGVPTEKGIPAIVREILRVAKPSNAKSAN